MQDGFNKRAAADHTARGICPLCEQLRDGFLSAVQEISILSSEQVRAVIDGDDAFGRFNILLEGAQERRRAAKYALIAHLQTHAH